MVDVVGSVDILDLMRKSAMADENEMPMAFSSSETPWSVDGISVEWLDDCLGAGAGKRSITDFSFKGETSGTSVRRSIQLKHTDGEVDTTVFAKTYPSFEHRVANVMTQTAQAEGAFYLELRPQLDIESPIGHYWSWDPETYRAIVIIEDIASSKGATFCNWQTSISFEEAQQVVRLLAKVHGTFLNDPTLSAKHPWLKSFHEWTQSFAYLKDQHMAAMEKASELLPQDLIGKGEALYNGFMRLRDDLGEMSSTLIHSDVHLGNWYKTEEGKVGLLDWQCCNIGPGIRDVAYALSTMLEIEDRRKWETDLLGSYVDQMKIHSDERYDFESNFFEYKRFLLAALMMWTPTLCPAPNFPNMQPEEMSRKMIERISAAIKDHKVLELI